MKVPRSNGPRDELSELNLAKRVRFERERRSWTLEALANRMAKVDCKIHLSALYKIEKRDPPRRITVAELVGFSRAFNMPIDELLVPVELVELAEGGALRDRMEALRQASYGLLQSAGEYVDNYRWIARASKSPGLREAIKDRGIQQHGVVDFEGLAGEGEDLETMKAVDQFMRVTRRRIDREVTE